MRRRPSWRNFSALRGVSIIPFLDEQFPYVASLARVAKAGFYHVGDVLYTVEERRALYGRGEEIPGIWHEACLTALERLT